MYISLQRCGILLFIIATSACGTTHSRWLENPDQVDIEQFEKDIGECRVSAVTVQTGGLTPEQTATSKNMAVNSLEPSASGVAGAIAMGVAGGFLQLQTEKQQLVRQCLANKGYKLRWYGPGEDLVKPAVPSTRTEASQ